MYNKYAGNLSTALHYNKLKTMHNDVAEHIIKIEGTVYEILAKVNKFEHVKENIYRDPNGTKWHLTKYGFEENIQHNLREELWKLQMELEDVSAELVTERSSEKTQELNKKLENQRNQLSISEKKLTNRKAEITKLQEKLAIKTDIGLILMVKEEKNEIIRGLNSKMIELKRELFYLKNGEHETESATEEE